MIGINFDSLGMDELKLSFEYEYLKCEQCSCE